MKIEINKKEIQKITGAERVNHYSATIKQTTLSIAAIFGITQKQAGYITHTESARKVLGLTAALAKEKTRQDKIQKSRAKLRCGQDKEINIIARKSRNRRDFLSQREFNRREWKRTLENGSGITALSDGSIFQYAPEWTWNPQTSWQRKNGCGSGFLADKIVRLHFWSEKKGAIITKKSWAVSSEPGARKIVRKNFPKKEKKHLLARIKSAGMAYDEKNKYYFFIGKPENNYHSELTMGEFIRAREIFQKRAHEGKKTARNAYFLGNAEKIFVKISDSTICGNCEYGTREFIAKHKLSFYAKRGRGLRGNILLALRNDDYTRRAVVAAGIRTGI